MAESVVTVLSSSTSNVQVFDFFFSFTLTKSENPGDDVGQNPGVSTELEQVVRENIDYSEAQPAREKKGLVKKYCFCVWGGVGDK